MSDNTFDENTKPEGTEDFVNTVAEDSEELTLAKDQYPALDELEVEDDPDGDDVPDGPATEGA